LRHAIIDTDPGVDDALALMLAFSSPELVVEAVTTVAGNVSILVLMDRALGQCRMNRGSTKVIWFQSLF